jgi:uncharacterized protein DUF6916
MSIARRSFLRSAALTTLSAGVALGSAELILGQQPMKGVAPERKTQPTRRIQRADTGDFPIPLEAQESELFHFKASTFTPYVGDIFQIPNARGEMITLRLVSVSEYKVKKGTRLATGKTRQTESFSLTFSAREKLSPFTSIHKMSHPALGKFDLFLTSRETEDGTFMYEAVFNRIE